MLHLGVRGVVSASFRGVSAELKPGTYLGGCAKVVCALNVGRLGWVCALSDEQLHDLGVAPLSCKEQGRNLQAPSSVEQELVRGGTGSAALLWRLWQVNGSRLGPSPPVYHHPPRTPLSQPDCAHGQCRGQPEGPQRTPAQQRGPLRAARSALRARVCRSPQSYLLWSAFNPWASWPCWLSPLYIYMAQRGALGLHARSAQSGPLTLVCCPVQTW